MSENISGVLNGSDVETLTTLIDKLEKSSFNYLKLENQDLNIVIGKNGEGEMVENTVPIRNQSALKEAAPTKEEPVQEIKPAEETPAVNTEEGMETIKASTAGIFYAQPEPGSDPYVKVGDTVQEDTTVGLIEIMKVYSALGAGISGEITQIHVEDNELVEYGQALFSVKVK